MPLTVADAAIAIGGDLAGFDKSLGQAEKKTLSLGERLKASFSPGKIIGAGLGAAFGIAATGALQLDAATRKLQADTGMTAEEAKRANHALAGMYRDNLQGFDEIGAAMAAVHNDLGLTGEAADKTTAKFLKFATATGQDAAEAVTAFDDILDAWNLTAADAGTVMDKLIAGHQKFGGVISESQSALAAMAPAMQAANMSIDDGIALLNLFNAAGIDASKAPAALARAVKELKPGQGLNDLIAQISSIEDPTLRGQEAMRIFGARGGIQLAQAFRPGIDSLDDFKTSTEENTDATTKAADAIESGWGAKFRQIMKWAGGALAEFGSNFGPLLMVAAAFGPKFTMAIASGLGGLGAVILPRIVGAFTGIVPLGVIAGTEIGIATSGGIATGVTAGGGKVRTAIAALLSPVGLGALAVAVTVGVVVEVAKEHDRAAIAAKATDELEKTAAEIQRRLDEGGFLFELSGMRGPIQAELDQINTELVRRAQPITEGFWKDVADGMGAGQVALASAMQKAIDGATASTAVRAMLSGGSLGARTVQGIAESILKTAKAILPVAAEDVVATFGLSLSGVVAASKRTGADGMLALAAGITAARAKPLDAFDTLKEMLKNQLTKSAETARLKGELHSKELARGMKSKDPVVRAQAIATKQLIIDRLNELKGPARTAGADAGTALATALLSKVTTAVTTAMTSIKGIFGAIGVPVPKPRASGAKRGASGLSHVAAYEPIIVGDAGRPELYIPDVPGRLLPSVPAASSSGGQGGNTYHVTVNNPEPRAAEPDIGRVLRRVAALGMA